MQQGTPRSHIYFSHRLRLHYVAWGQKGAPPLLLVHGGRDHSRNWDWVAQALQEEFLIIAPDLRGHGDSDWMIGSPYTLIDFVYDIDQLLHQTQLSPISIVGHSLGGVLAMYYTGLFPNRVSRVLSIEGMAGYPLQFWQTPENIADRMFHWIENSRKLSSRVPRKYATLEDAVERMLAVNSYLTETQARHLTVHGSHQNEDGTYSWKFDNYIRVFPPISLSHAETKHLYRRITCPTMLVYGENSWAGSPHNNEFLEYLSDLEVRPIQRAGHWCHHDQLEEFLSIARKFLTT